MEITVKKTKLSPEKLNDVKVHWAIINQPSQKALENFNRLLAAAQIRVHHSSLKGN